MESMGVASGCGCKEVLYRFPHITYPYSSCVSFLLLFVHLKNVFRSCSSTFS